MSTASAQVPQTQFLPRLDVCMPVGLFWQFSGVSGHSMLHAEQALLAHVDVFELLQPFTCRLRVSLSAVHTAADIEQLAAAIKSLKLHFLPMQQVLGGASHPTPPVAKL